METEEKKNESALKILTPDAYFVLNFLMELDAENRAKSVRVTYSEIGEIFRTHKPKAEPVTLRIRAIKAVKELTAKKMVKKLLAPAGRSDGNVYLLY